MEESGLGTNTVGQAISGVRSSAATLRQTVAEANEPLSSSDEKGILAFADAAEQATSSSNDELRDNLLSAYGVAVRPRLQATEPSHSHLRIDAAVNDLRDSVLSAESIAARAGYRSISTEIAAARPEVVDREQMRSEAQSIQVYLQKVKSELQAPEIRQVGLINIYIKEIGIKNTIAGIIAKADSIDLRGLGTAIAGIVRLLNSALTASQQLARATRRGLEVILKKARDTASLAFDTIRTVAKRLFGDEKEEDKAPRIWTESEVHELIAKGQPVPSEASPFVRTLTLARSDIKSLNHASELRELRRLTVDTSGPLDARALEGISTLEFVTLDTYGDIDLSTCVNLPRLRELKIQTYGTIYKLRLPQQINWPALEKLDIDGFEIEHFPSFANSRKLTVALFSDCKFPPKELASLSRVKVLALQNMTIEALDFVGAMESLEELDIRYSAVRQLHALAAAPSLQRLRMSRSVANNLYLGYVPARVEITGEYGGKIRKRTR